MANITEDLIDVLSSRLNRCFCICPHFRQKSNQGQPRPDACGPSLPEEGVMDAIGVAMMLLGLRAASCCICTAATVATGER